MKRVTFVLSLAAAMGLMDGNCDWLCPGQQVEDLLKPENKKKLASILTYHVVAGQVLAADVVKLKEAKTVEGSKVKIEVKDGKVKVNDANVVKTDIICKNGVIHIIDAVILPK